MMGGPNLEEPDEYLTKGYGTPHWPTEPRNVHTPRKVSEHLDDKSALHKAVCEEVFRVGVDEALKNVENIIQNLKKQSR